MIRRSRWNCGKVDRRVRGEVEGGGTSGGSRDKSKEKWREGGQVEGGGTSGGSGDKWREKWREGDKWREEGQVEGVGTSGGRQCVFLVKFILNNNRE